MDVLRAELLLEAVADDLERVDLVADEPVVVRDATRGVVIQKVLASFSFQLVDRSVVEASSFQPGEHLAFQRVKLLVNQSGNL